MITRLHVSLFVLLLVAVGLALGATFDRPTFASSPADECAPPSAADVAAVHQAADAYMSARYAPIYAGAEVRRVIGDWALVVVVPKVQADRAALILHRVAPQTWVVAAGPGTAFPPGARPAGMPPELLDVESRCGAV